MTYLDPAPFSAHGITVTPFQPSVISSVHFDRRISALWSLATLGPDAVAALLRTVAAGHGALQPV
jgi:hypothetical protein